MGLLTDYFVASRSQIDDALLQHGPQPPLAVLDSKGVDYVLIATLTTIFLNENLDDVDAVVANSPPCEVDAGSDGPWIFNIPEHVTKSLAALDEDGRRDIAHRWAQTEEWCSLEWPENEYQEWFNDFANLASLAVQQDSGLWLWMSL